MQVVGVGGDEIAVEGVVFKLLHFKKFDVFAAPLPNIFVVEQSCLLNGNNLVLGRVHHQKWALYITYLVNVGEVVVLELYSRLVLLVEHARKRPNWTL